jgi:hypothetical protein
MKHFKLLLTILFLSLYVNSYGQKSQKEIDLEKNKVQIFSAEERANLQLHFYDKTQEMNLPEDVEEDYYRLVLHYIYDMQRLNDKDKDFTDAEVKLELEKLVTKMNSKIELVLTKEKYHMHLNNFNDLLKSIYRRNAWEYKE